MPEHKPWCAYMNGDPCDCGAHADSVNTPASDTESVSTAQQMNDSEPATCGIAGCEGNHWPQHHNEAVSKSDRKAVDDRIIPAEQRAQIRATLGGGWDGPLDMERDLLDHAEAMDEVLRGREWAMAAWWFDHKQITGRLRAELAEAKDRSRWIAKAGKLAEDNAALRAAGSRLAQSLMNPAMTVSHQVVNPAIIGSPCLPTCSGCALEAEWRGSIDQWQEANRGG